MTLLTTTPDNQPIRVLERIAINAGKTVPELIPVLGDIPQKLFTLSI